ncbi:hypothetical protein BHE74_00018135, partial [Ensete ventricosum]
VGPTQHPSKTAGPYGALLANSWDGLKAPAPLLYNGDAHWLSLVRNCPQTSINSADMLGSSSRMSDQEKDSVPMPIVSIDQDSDTDATIVQLSFGDRLGALVDTMRSLKNLGLDVTKGTVTTEDSVVKTKFFIMRA